MSLRDEAITHMCEAVWPNDYKMTPMVTTELCEAHLDALLDFLDAHTEEWGPSVVTIGERGYSITVGAGTMRKELLAALRGTTEEPQ